MSSTRSGARDAQSRIGGMLTARREARTAGGASSERHAGKARCGQRVGQQPVDGREAREWMSVWGRRWSQSIQQVKKDSSWAYLSP